MSFKVKAGKEKLNKKYKRAMGKFVNNCIQAEVTDFVAHLILGWTSLAKNYNTVYNYE